MSALFLLMLPTTVTVALLTNYNGLFLLSLIVTMFAGYKAYKQNA